MTGAYLNRLPAMQKAAIKIGQKISHMLVMLWKLYNAGLAFRDACSKKVSSMATYYLPSSAAVLSKKPAHRHNLCMMS